MKLSYRRIVWVAGGLLVLALSVAFVGLLPTRASAGHWTVTRWFLSFFKARSVALYAVAVPPPPVLDDPRRVVRGATHYETACASCHGAPGQEPSVVSGSMTPDPPRLDARVDEWAPEELFHITLHGIKFTGMPAWPALGREDEVWDMVAFMRRLPGLGEAEYRRLSWGELAEAGAADVQETGPGAGPGGAEAEAERIGVSGDVLANCARCHGRDGNGRAGAFPRLAGQKPSYLAAALDAFAERRRMSGVMQPVAAALPADVRQALALHYAALPPRAAPSGEPIRAPDLAAAGGGGAAARGAEIAARGVPRERVPACGPCHGPGAAARNPHYPNLAGQSREYIALQLRLFRDGDRGGSVYAPIMQEIGPRLSEQQIQDVAAWYASLPPGA